MKELSIEEKAKRYDEAIEKARIWKDKSGMPKDKQGILDDIFPELAESEDERIVKELLTFFRESIHGGHILTNKEYDSWIAWLEKQGEHDSIEEPDFFDDFRNSDVEIDSNEDGLIAETMKYKSEQKTAWNEEDEKMFECALNMIELYDVVDKDKSRLVSDWLKSLRQTIGG